MPQENKIVIEDMDYIVEKFRDYNIFRNKTILITGCAGFLGFYFIKFFVRLMEKGINIKRLILLDTFLFNKPDWLLNIGNKVAKIEIYHFNIAKDNMYQHETHYFSSEMADTELRNRLELFPDIKKLEDWSFEPWERSSNFADVIRPDALNIIDYLEIHDTRYLLPDRRNA